MGGGLIKRLLVKSLTLAVIVMFLSLSGSQNRPVAVHEFIKNPSANVPKTAFLEIAEKLEKFR